MPKKSSTRRHQKIYKMKGCSKKRSKKNLRGGRVSSDTYLAFTGKELINSPTNPHLAYSGRGGGELSPIPDVMSPNFSQNLYGGNPAPANTGPYNLTNAYPARDPPFNAKANTITNMGYMQRGGNGCSLCNLMNGGKKMKNGKKMKGGNCNGQCGLVGGRTLDPQGLVGKPWTPNITGWPGVDGIAGDRNYLDYNQYKVDPQTALISVGANRPFLFGGKKKRSLKKNMKGGALSNFLPQDFVNLGRQLQYNMGSTYNAINGYAQPVNPLPWKDQLPRTPNLTTIRGNSI
jgi:hypothetical protein